MIRTGLTAMLVLATMVATASAQITPGSSAGTLVAPPANDPGRAGQMMMLPQGGQGVTFGGTPYSQMIGTPTGGATIMTPSGGGASTIISPGVPH